MRINPLSAAIGFALIERDLHDLEHRIKAPGPGANTATLADGCANPPHSMTGLPRGGCNVSPRASGEGFADG